MCYRKEYKLLLQIRTKISYYRPEARTMLSTSNMRPSFSSCEEKKKKEILEEEEMKIRPRNHENRTEHNLVGDERKQEKTDRVVDMRDRSLYHNRMKYDQACHNSRKMMV